MTRHIAILTLALTAALSADEAFAAITVNTNVTSRDVEDVILIAVVLINAPADKQYEMVADLYDADPVLAADILDVAEELMKADRKFLANVDMQTQIVGENGLVSPAADTDELGIAIAIIAVADPHGDRTNQRGAEVTQDEYLALKEPAKYHKGTHSVEGNDFP